MRDPRATGGIDGKPHTQDHATRQALKGCGDSIFVQRKSDCGASVPQPFKMTRPQADPAIRLGAHCLEHDQVFGDRSRNADLHNASSHSDPARLSWVMPPPTFSRSRPGAVITGVRMATPKRIGPDGSSQPIAPQ